MLASIIILFILMGVIMVQQSALARTMRDARAKMEKVGTEIEGLQATNSELQTRVTVLEQKLEDLEVGQEVTQDLLDAATAVVEQAQVLDDKIPDSPVLAPPAEGEIEETKGTTG